MSEEQVILNPDSELGQKVYLVEQAVKEITALKTAATNISRTNYPLFKRMEAMANKSIKELKAFDADVAEYYAKVEENKLKAAIEAGELDDPNTEPTDSAPTTEGGDDTKKEQDTGGLSALDKLKAKNS